MASVGSDEEAKLLNQLEDLAPEKDPELKKNGGKFDEKTSFLQVTIRWPIDTHPLNLIALLYGFLPFIVPASFFVAAIVTQRFIPVFAFVMSIVTSLINEVIFKPLLKDPRPTRSAHRHLGKDGKWEMKPGMPSGHVLNATCILVWAVLEVGLRGPGFDHDHSFLTAGWIVAIIVLMAPVPWARWYNGDHSLNQCLVAASLGIVVGVLAYYLRVTYFPQSWKPWESMPEEESRPLSTAASMIASRFAGSHTKEVVAGSLATASAKALRGSDTACKGGRCEADKAEKKEEKKEAKKDVAEKKEEKKEAKKDVAEKKEEKKEAKKDVAEKKEEKKEDKKEAQKKGAEKKEAKKEDKKEAKKEAKKEKTEEAAKDAEQDEK